MNICVSWICHSVGTIRIEHFLIRRICNSDLNAEESWRMLVLVCLILFICNVCLGLSWYICWTRSSFDWLHNMKYSTFLGLQVSNPHNTKPFQERSFLREEATVQLCHKWTDPDSVSQYQNTMVAAKKWPTISKYEKTCKTTMIKNSWIIIQYIQTHSNINLAHRLRPSSFNLESQASSDPRKQTRFRQICWSENCSCL